ncbi:MAG: 4-hydroxythreonine-4-phosphate dehydrogenase PdxA [Opitutales bacterium]
MSAAAKLAPIALTCGDPAGVGPEVVLRWLEENPGAAPAVCAIGPASWLEHLRVAVDPTMATVEVGASDQRHEPGQPTDAGARCALEAMDAAAAGCLEGQFRAVVTGPISKARVQAVGYALPGQTEFFAQAWGGTPTMAFAGGRLRVVLATWHIPLADVPNALDEPTLTLAVERAVFLVQALGHDHPRIALCGLNPHAGEAGLLGTEEFDRLNPIADKLRERFPGLTRCLPADTVFHRQLQGEFDVVVALYHDQGLAPLKTLEFDRAVNLTLGLPFIRTSPDHGTAFDLAGRGLANHTSFANAVELADRLARYQASQRVDP